MLQCKGSYSLGSACGSCPKCQQEANKLIPQYRTEIAELIAKMETLQKEHQWIPVSERLPEPNEHVFIYWQDDGEALRETGFYVIENNRQYWQSLDNAYPLNVTHWQPLPEPPTL